MDLAKLLSTLKPQSIFPGKVYEPVDLSPRGIDEHGLSLLDRNSIEAWFNKHTEGNKVLYGGYLEKRMWYGRNPNFISEKALRNIHIGTDIWAPVGTAVHLPIQGQLHSKSFIDEAGDYGHVAIFEHRQFDQPFYTLYGHLGHDVWEELKKDIDYAAGSMIGLLGSWEENGHWPSHLHFQVIKDMEGRQGDFPGVCLESEMDKYLELCPDPKMLIAELI
ncbi:MAG: peptidoglycan DD-metalloendopeptidase family protein [Luteibaculum sp.]